MVEREIAEAEALLQDGARRGRDDEAQPANEQVLLPRRAAYLHVLSPHPAAIALPQPPR